MTLVVSAFRFLRLKFFMRVFIAIELPASVRELVAKRNLHLREEFPRVRAGWERVEKMHITMKFLGEVDEHQLTKIQDTLTQTVKDFRPFEISIEGTGAFPPRGVPRILWLGVEDESETLLLIQERLENEFAKIGFKKETRKFHPHITLARIRTPDGAKGLREKHEQLDFQSEAFMVSEIFLIKSQLSPSGSQYTKLSSHKFRA